MIREIMRGCAKKKSLDRPGRWRQLARIRQVALMHRKKSHGILAVLQSHEVSPQIQELRIITEQMRTLLGIYE
jgi:hypothetical protein